MSLQSFAMPAWGWALRAIIPLQILAGLRIAIRLTGSQRDLRNRRSEGIHLPNTGAAARVFAGMRAGGHAGMHTVGHVAMWAGGHVARGDFSVSSCGEAGDPAQPLRRMFHRRAVRRRA